MVLRGNEKMFKQKLLIIIVSLILVYPMVFLFAKEKSDLEMIASSLASELIVLEQWTIYASENMETAKATELFASLINNNEWNVTKEITQTSITQKAVKNDLSYTETILLVTPANSNLSYFCFEISGSEFEENLDLFSSLEKKVKSNFPSNTRLFSYVKGHYKHENNNSLQNKVNAILNTLEAEKVEGLEEDQFVSISAVSPKWKEAIYSNNKKINLQVGLRLEQTETKWVTNVIVGTPIITIEY